MKQLGSKVLETARLILRPFCAADAQQAFTNWMSDAEVTRYLTWTPHTDISFTRQLLEQWGQESVLSDVYHWAIVWRKTGEVIGDICVVSSDKRSERAELGYCLSRAFWGRGIMTEALLAVINFLIEQVGFSRIEAKHATANPASGRVMEKCGMKEEGVLHRYYCLPSTGEWVDVSVHAILRGDWQARRFGAARWMNVTWQAM